MRPLTLSRLLTHCAVLGVILFVVVVVALKLGAVPVSLYGLGRALVRVLFHQTSELSSEYRMIVFDIRLPRVLLGIFVGASLSVAGASFQALLRNPLADPYVLGVSSGAAVGAIASPTLRSLRKLPPFSRPLALFSARLPPSPRSTSWAGVRVKSTVARSSSRESFPLLFFKPSSCIS